MHSKKGTKPNGRAVFIGVSVGMAVTIILLFISAFLIESDKVSEEQTKLMIIVINALAGILCGIAAKWAAGEGGGINGLISGFIYASVLLIVGLMIEAGEPEGGEIIRQYAITTVAGYIGGKMNLVKSNKKIHKKSK